ncbi:hypothetical protein K505DRAFT_359921 [Melanomma pulvis-pyrius CBS 109.77]|uniref:Uncharacterized protein n=1 Tax=Melanomma pulvis-pyrius CBS 109.77 TaxID=1314802 RepID=A0A6A6XGW2_9PLEO|nr:hypothetical protein K505DRAFT_359921 [Melanomma pulvis-pyrius CBS 109.77]
MIAIANSTSVPENASPMPSMDVPDLEAFPKDNEEQDPLPLKTHGEHIIQTKFRMCYSSPPEYYFQAAIDSIRARKEIPASEYVPPFMDPKNSPPIRIHKAGLYKALDLLYFNDVFGEAQLCSTPRFQRLLTAEDGRTLAHSIHEFLIAYIESLLYGRTTRTVSRFDLEQDFASAFGLVWVDYTKPAGLRRFFDLPSFAVPASRLTCSLNPYATVLELAAMNFSNEDFVVSTTTKRPTKAKRPKRIHISQGQITRPVALPSPAFAGINEEGLNSEPFPDFTDLATPTNDQTIEHCMLHCEHSICMELKKMKGFTPTACKCHLIPKTHETVRPGPQIIINDDLFRSVAQDCRSFSVDMSITIHLADVLDILGQLQLRFEHHQSLLQLVVDLQNHLPEDNAVLATGDAFLFFFDDVVDFFTRSIALHGQGPHQRIISVRGLYTEWRDYMYITMIDLLEEYFPTSLEFTMGPSAIAKMYIYQGVLKGVWGLWTGIWEELVSVLAWRDVQLTETGKALQNEGS